MTILSAPTAPTKEEARLAKASGRTLAALAARREQHGLKMKIAGAGKNGDAVELPRPAVELLVTLLHEMGQGNMVALMPLHALLTTQETANLLGVSRPFVVKEIEEGRLKYRKIGTHRRVALADAMEYRKQCMRVHDEAMDELVKLNQEMKLGYQ